MNFIDNIDSFSVGRGCVKIGTSSFFYRKAPTFSSQGFVMSKIFCTFGP